MSEFYYEDTSFSHTCIKQIQEISNENNHERWLFLIANYGWHLSYYTRSKSLH